MTSSTGTLPTDMKPVIVSDALARATLQALLDSDLIGVALLREGDWSHVVTNRTYDAMVSGKPAIGRCLSEVLAPEVVSSSALETVTSTGRAVHVSRARLPPRNTDATALERYLSISLLPVRSMTIEADGVLVLARDISKEVHAERMAELLLLLARDMSAERDEAATIRSGVARAKAALGANAASIFLLGPDGKSLHGALVGWDWTRSSFVTDIEDWPNVARVVTANEARYLSAQSAERAEEGWFELRGIEGAICAPMAVGDRVVGVLFFDYIASSRPAVDLQLAKAIADQCALLVERATATGSPFERPFG